MSETDMHRASTLVLGVGNILLRDEGVGVHAVHELQNSCYSHMADFVDGGTSGWGLIDVIAGRHKLIVVDAGDIKGKPGSITRLSYGDLLRRDAAEVSLHEFGLADALYEAQALGVLPQEIVIFAVKPKDITPSMEMSEEVLDAMPRIVELVVAEIERN